MGSGFDNIWSQTLDDRLCIPRALVLRGGGVIFCYLSISFSAVSRPNFTSKYSFFSIFQDLQDPHTFAPLHIQNLRIFFEIFVKKWWIFEIFAKFLWNLLKSAFFRRNFNGFLSELREMLNKFQKCRKKMQKFAKLHEKWWNFADFP